MCVRETEVLIAGGGPVGAIGAVRLASMGIDVLCCEQTESFASDLRASTIHAATLEMLDAVDAAEPLIAKGLKAPVYQWRDRRSGEHYDFDLGEVADVARFPFRLQCPQHHMAGLLTQTLPSMANAEMRFGTKLISAHEDAEGVVATLEKDGRTEEVRAKFLVGADGSHSTVRKLMGVDFEGFTYEEKFVSVSTAHPIEETMRDIALVNYIADPEEWLVLLAVPGLWRILVPGDKAVSDEELLRDEAIADIFARIVPGTPVETTFRKIYRVHQRVASLFHKGRMLLVGDAAHINNPLGGFGMNSGIHDVWNLADKLWSVLRQDGDSEQLALFDRQRRGITKAFIQAQSIENKAFMEHAPGEAHAARLARMAGIANDPVKRREYLLKQAMFQSLADAEKIA
ncbi:FAD-dependent monooxygenase [Novosphingobium sp. 2637]|uniref:FAD-dependent monooxygenase n=1 Tax=Novosphingobium mangrovi (ex Hu et al. 2023) TaxID=2930094 RepID=A0ABT0ACL9_9SPHN|nr:FAD-dependent monooxygenase [Novosphingobium mangrovi (ex Hu et al. 2023)]MCJ1960919.1 FAD-dependent monooxygenase [Novosphingobium mangrovi (ex Hu et al. 2023)]